jgi:hypothetical protein
MGTAPHIKGRFSSQLNRFSLSMHWLPEKHQSGSTWPSMPARQSVRGLRTLMQVVKGYSGREVGGELDGHGYSKCVVERRFDAGIDAMKLDLKSARSRLPKRLQAS